MANRDRDSMENQGNAGLGILGGLLVLAVGGAVRHGKKTELERELKEVQAELQSYRSKAFSSLLYSNEIAALEKREKAILQQLR